MSVKEWRREERPQVKEEGGGEEEGRGGEEKEERERKTREERHGGSRIRPQRRHKGNNHGQTVGPSPKLRGPRL